MVNQIGIKITAGLDLEQLLETIHEQCQQIGHADSFYIALYDHATGDLNFPFSYSAGKRIYHSAINIREKPILASHIIETY